VEALSEPVDYELRHEEGARLRLFKERSAGAARLTSYRQTHLGLRAWETAFEISMQDDPPRITSARTSVHRGRRRVGRPPRNARFLPGRKAGDLTDETRRPGERQARSDHRPAPLD